MSKLAKPANVAQRDAWLDKRLPEVEQVRPGLWSIPVPIPINPLRYVLVYALEHARGVTLIDAGWNTDEAYEALTAGLATAGYRLTDIESILVTHIHPDHYGLAGRLRDETGAWIGLHPADARLVQGRYADTAIDDLIRQEHALLLRCGVPDLTAEELSLASMVIKSLVTMAAPDRLIDDGDHLDLPGWNLRALWTPGHSPGHLCFTDPDRRLLFSGDHVLAKITPIIAVHPQSAPNPLADYLDALRAIAKLDITETLPAHEYRFTDLPARLDYLLGHHEARLTEITNAVGESNGTTCWDLAARLTWSRPWTEIPPFMQRSANNETLAHLIWLEHQGRLTRTHGEPDLWHRTR